MRINIADIRRLTLHDGPGTRTTVFVKGCPLRCLWCHNPETFSARSLLIFHENLCSSCGKCRTVCLADVHRFSEKGHEIVREICTFCGNCTEACLHGALEISGVSYSPEELLPLLLRDRMFYKTGGGVTFSGGEPLLYPEFIAEVFSMLHQQGIHTALDTCGDVPFGAFLKVLPFTDLILFDLKGMDPEKHRQNTGRTNALIHENLLRLGGENTPVEIRIPVIPGHNDSDQEFHEAGRFLRKIPAVTAVRLLPYHEMAREKYLAAGLKDTMPKAEPPTAGSIAGKAEILRRYISVPVHF